jgi:hypothetical protein
MPTAFHRDTSSEPLLLPTPQDGRNFATLKCIAYPQMHVQLNTTYHFGRTAGFPCGETVTSEDSCFAPRGGFKSVSTVFGIFLAPSKGGLVEAPQTVLTVAEGAAATKIAKGLHW